MVRILLAVRNDMRACSDRFVSSVSAITGAPFSANEDVDNNDTVSHTIIGKHGIPSSAAHTYYRKACVLCIVDQS